MTLLSFPIRLRSLKRIWERAPTPRLSLSALASLPRSKLPRFVQDSEVALKYMQLLGMLDWQHFPDRPDQRFSPLEPPLPYAPLVAAYLVKIDQHIACVADLWQYLIENPALVWVLGFPLCPSRTFPWGFDVKASLPTHRHLSRLLRTMPNTSPQFLLDDTIRSIRRELNGELPPETRFGECISLDTKHIIAWVKENNPKTFIEQGRYDKTRQPAGDPDCRLGCKRKHNQRRKKDAVESLPADVAQTDFGEYYWGYGSGVVATKVADWGEFVIAELTQSFDQSDVSYFKLLMEKVEQRLGFRPRFGAFDAAFDAFYVYEYFANAEPPGFAAVPFVERGRKINRQFNSQGLPLCEAGLAMSLRYVFWCKTSLIPHERGRFICPLIHPTNTGQVCPAQHANWEKGGCVTTLATSPGARLRYQLDRHSEEYKVVYKQRTATERINSQAVDLGIERPKLRNRASITNHNTLTYVLINLHALQRIRLRKAQRIQAVSSSKERA
jgi:hypothetical protein